MKKIRNIVGFMIVICCAVIFGMFLARMSLWGKIVHKVKGSANEISDETNIVVGQDQSFTSDINIDILSRHSLPSLERMEKSDQDQYVNNLEVIKKIDLLGIEKNELLYPEKQMSSIEKNVSLIKDAYDLEGDRIVFQGTTSEELQQVINENPNIVIDINVDQIQLHDTITLIENTMIMGNGVKFIAENDLQYGFKGENISNIYVNDICIEGNIDYGLYFVDCSNISVLSCKINGMKQKSMCIIGTTKGIEIRNNQMCNNHAGGLFIAGNISNGIVDSNNIENNGGTSNWMAGIVLTSIVPNDKYNIWEMFDEAHHFPHRENYHAQSDCPHDIIVSNNQVRYNTASGIYSDGAYMCYVLNNTVYQNDKEGICLDYATIGFYLKQNIVKENGRRARQTDEDLRMDFVLEAGKMDDGSAKAKLPGVSLDDTAYNIIENNLVMNNYGGGIKMVRTTVRTLIFENIVRDNNMGQNDMFHFFGIELGAAAGDVNGANTAANFMPDYENIICRNSITGNHYSGIFVGEECYVNDIFDNVIMESQMFAVEAISKRFNSIVNNLSNVGIRNEFQVK